MWLYPGKSSCIRAKVVKFGQSGWFRGKTHVFGQSGCIWEKVVVFGQSGFIRAKEFVFDQSGCIHTKVVVFWVVVLFGQKCICVKWLLSGKSCCIRAN